MKEQHEIIKKDVIEKELNVSFEELLEKRRQIEIDFKERFSTYNEFGKYCFSYIVKNCKYGAESSNWTLVEKCLRRDHDITFAKANFELDKNMLNELSNAELLFLMIDQVIPFDILWAMEFKFASEEKFTKKELEAFKHLSNLANYYLIHTDKFEFILKENNESKKIK